VVSAARREANPGNRLRIGQLAVSVGVGGGLVGCGSALASLEELISLASADAGAKGTVIVVSIDLELWAPMAMRHNDVPRMTRLALLVPATRHALIRAQVYGKIARKLASALRDFLTES